MIADTIRVSMPLAQLIFIMVVCVCAGMLIAAVTLNPRR